VGPAGRLAGRLLAGKPVRLAQVCRVRPAGEAELGAAQRAYQGAAARWAAGLVELGAEERRAWQTVEGLLAGQQLGRLLLLLALD